MRPEQATSDTASCSDQVFALFHLPGHQFPSCLVDAAGQRFSPLERGANAGVLKEVSRN